VTDVLTRHAAAVLARSPSAFLADVDTADTAADFRARQRAQIANIAQVPLQSWRYSVGAPVTEPAAGTAAAKRLGAPALIVRVSLTYALQVVDAQPSVHDLWWTFTRRHGHVYLAGDSDLAELGGTSWRGPWDFGPLVVARGASSLVLGHPQAASQLVPLPAIVDAVAPVVTAIWGTGWSRQVAVLVPASDAELSALAGSGSVLTDISAITVSDAPDPVNGTRTGQRLVLNPSALSKLTAAGLRVVVQHELTHIASASATGQASPRWLVEGLAEYVANLGSPQPVSVAASELRKEVVGGTLPAALPSEADFAPGAARLPQVYEEAWLACRFIAARAGQDGLVTFYRLVGASPDVAATALSAALRQVLHLTPAAFTAQWRSYLVGTLG